MYIPDPFKLDVIRFLDSPAGKAFVSALEARRPSPPDANLPHSTKLSTYDQRAGYEQALAEMQRLPRETAPETPKTPVENPLFSPKD